MVESSTAAVRSFADAMAALEPADARGYAFDMEAVSAVAVSEVAVSAVAEEVSSEPDNKLKAAGFFSAASAEKEGEKGDQEKRSEIEARFRRAQVSRSEHSVGT